MSDFPKGGDIQATRDWLDKEGFRGKFIGWRADAILGLEERHILRLVGNEHEGLNIWGLLNTARQLPTPQHVFRNAVVHYKTFKAHIRFSNYNELMDEIENIDHWKTDLKFSYFHVSHEEDNLLYDLPHDLKGVPTDRNLKIVISLRSQGFATAALKPWEALASLHSLYKDVGLIPRNDNAFPECATIPRQIFETAAQTVVATLRDKAKAINLSIASEDNALREFISPILIAAVNVVIDYCSTLPHSSIDTSKLSLVCESIVLGMSAYGHVDYTILFDLFDLVVSVAAKRTALDAGVVQCLLQQRASQEFLANILVGIDEYGETRKRKFDHAFSIVSTIPTYGITSTGYDWVLSTYTNNSDPGKHTKVCLSNTIHLNLFNPDSTTVCGLLSRIVNIILQQIVAVQSSTRLLKAANNGLPTNTVLSDRMKPCIGFQSISTPEIEERYVEEDEADKRI